METQADTTPAVRPIAGFWRRLVALVVDLALLGTLGAAAGLVGFDVLAVLGASGRIAGFLVALAYFGVLNSRIGGGQTLGKRLLGIRVVDGDGTLLSLPRSLARYGVLGIPFFLNGAAFGADVLLSPWAWLVCAVVFGGMLSIVYLYLFNRRTRRSLHDLAVGSWVVAARPAQGRVPAISTWRGHLVVVGLLFAVSFAAPAVFAGQMEDGVIGDLAILSAAIDARPGVRHVEVHVNYDMERWEPDGHIVIRVRLEDDDIHDEALAREIARHVVRAELARLETRQVTVVLKHGYDIGLASAWRNHEYTFDADDFAPGQATQGAEG